MTSNNVAAIFEDFPANWELTTLGDVCKRAGGYVQTGPFGSQLHASDYVEEGIPTIMPINIGDNQILTDGIARITEMDAERLSRHRLEPGDIVFSRRGDVTRRALIREEQKGWLCGTGSLKIHFGEGVVDPQFASLYFAHPDVKDWIIRHAVGSTMPNLNGKIMEAIPFLLPPKKEQEKIANILGALEDKIGLNRRMNHTLEEMARALFISWFVDFDPVTAKAEGRVPFGMNVEMASLFPSEFEETEEGTLPKGWKIGSLDQIFPKSKDVVLTGPFGTNLHAHDYRDDGVPLILVKHVNDGHISEDGLPLVGQHKIQELQKYRLKKGDIVFTRVGAVGRSAYVHSHHEGWMISGQMLRVRLKNSEQIDSRYLAQIYLEPDFIDMVEGHALGTTRPSLNTEILLSFKFLIPSAEVQNSYRNTVSIMDAQIQNNIRENSNLASIRDTLLPKLLSGELRVKQAEKVIEKM